ncbi:family 20 glycosylhydrolase [Shewanella intestini]|uniref:beta-N-acetylhexosaminidase n=1 Tax=Shewanella intestini TaxID=2017544 RepID=A0ABS5HY60_9GAMM|nr:MULTISPECIES: family 20 glycosylhydrolase [Shewanella]MBR9726707.1 family 20 glycosylhydrolase [Shewanella intestini]MRG34727.1 family 20 glycosylhydrolase [Shewanella sp. XMDDZSB0408]
MNVIAAASTLCIMLSLSACVDISPSTSDKISSSTDTPLTQHTLDTFAQQLAVSYDVITNVPEQACAKEADKQAHCFIAEIEFVSQNDFTHHNWEIYYSQMRPVIDVLSDEFTLTHIKGDLHRITPTEKFNGFKAKQAKTLRFRAQHWQLSETDAMPNYYIVATDNEQLLPAVISSTELIIDPVTKLEQRPYVVPFTDPVKQYRRSATDKLKWQQPADIYVKNANLTGNLQPNSPTLLASSIIPTPLSQQVFDDKPLVDFSQGLLIESQSFAKANIKPSDIQAALLRLETIGVSSRISNDNLPDEHKHITRSQPLTSSPVTSARDTQSTSPESQSLSLDPSQEAPSKLSALTVQLLPLQEARLTQDKYRQGHYQLDIADNGIMIYANDASGFSYAFASIQSLINPQSLVIPAMKVIDAPRYDFRGMHIDVSRNFHSKAAIFKLIEQMATYKLNKLHLHMGDDEGWRLEIDGLPELTDIGSKRCHDLTETRCLLPQLGSGPFADSPVNGFYSINDYIEIIQFADARQIQVIPSMDMPGHSRAAIISMQARYQHYMQAGQVALANEYLLYDPLDSTQYSSVQYYDDNTLNVCMPSTYHFIDKVITEIAAMHQQAGQPLTTYHIGADETAGAWKDSPLCQTLIANNSDINSAEQLGPYFIERVSNMLHKKGIQNAGWSDGMSHTQVNNMPKNSQSNIWDVISHGGYKNAHKQINQGWTSILSHPEVLYFDFPYQADPKEHGYYWATRALSSYKLFSFMSGNLPANAEQWRDIENLPFEADDRVVKDDNGQRLSGPLAKGKRASGIQGQLWSETIRSQTQLEYMIYPRLLMLAERAWHRPRWEVPYQYQGVVYNQHSGYFTADKRQQQTMQWQRISNHLGAKEFAKLDKFAIHYRLPIPGVKVVNNQLSMNSAFTGLTLEYKQDKGQWTTYKAPVEVTLPLEVRTSAPDGIRKGRSVKVN